MKKKIMSKILLISVITGIFVLGGVALCSAENPIIKKPPMPAPIDIMNIKPVSYKSIKPIPNKTLNLSETPTSYEALIKINTLEKDIEEYLTSEHSSIEKNSIYRIYLKNLSYYASYLDKFNTENLNSENIYNSIEYVSDRYNYHIRENESLNFAYPYHCSSIKFLDVEHGFVYPEINAEYQYYLTLFLNQNWQRYWLIRRREQKDLHGVAYIYYDGERSVQVNVLAEWIILWSIFQTQNTNSELDNDVKDRIDEYIAGFLEPNVYDYNNWGECKGGYDYNGEYIDECDYRIQYPIRPLTPRGQAEFERLINNLPKNSYAYNLVNKSYDILKNNNNTTSKEYYNVFQKSNL